MGPVIQQGQIRDRATKQSYSRGESYYRSGSIFDTIRRGNEIQGRCEGSSVTPYHVSATLDADGTVQEAYCDCDYTWEGDCKHIVALLLAYANEPERFQELATLDDALGKRSREELIVLIREMILRAPDLWALVDRPFVAQQAEDGQINLNAFRRELRAVLRDANWEGDEWEEHFRRDTPDAETVILSIANAAHEFANAGKWLDASAIYKVIIEECHNKFPLDDGEYFSPLNAVLAAMVECLQQDEIAGNDEERLSLLDHLLTAYIWNINMGSQGLGEEILPGVLFQYAQAKDRAHIRERVEKEQTIKWKSEFGKWAVGNYESLLAQLDTLENADPETAIERMYRLSLHLPLFAKLLELGRVNEAIAVGKLIRQQDQDVALRQLVAAGYNEEAIQLAKTSLSKHYDFYLAEWLAERYAASGEYQALLELRLQGMKERPMVKGYEQLKEASEVLGQWAVVRPKLIRDLHKAGQKSVLVQIYLHDEEWDAAWETWETLKGLVTIGLENEIALTSRFARPDKAVPIFLKYARQSIQEKNRQGYRRAAEHLTIIRETYLETGHEKRWSELFAGIRSEFRALRALQDEFRQAGLLEESRPTGRTK